MRRTMIERVRWFHVMVLGGVALWLLGPPAALASDGASGPPGRSAQTYYQSVVANAQTPAGAPLHQELAAASLRWLGRALGSPDRVAVSGGSLMLDEDPRPAGGLPEQLHLVDADAFVEYRALDDRGEGTQWEARVRNFLRRHEKIDAVYDMVLVLPLPADVAGSDAFDAGSGGVALWEGSELQPTPLVYGGNGISLKRNPGLETSLLPSIGVGAGEGELPSLEGTGYRYTLWDAVVRYDPSHGDIAQGWASLRYTTAPAVVGPDARDERLAAYWITWIPSLSADTPPFAVKMDVRDPRE